MQSRKLSQQQIKEIQCAYASGGFNQSELGSLYGVTAATISNVVRGKFTIEAKIKTSAEINILEGLKELGIASIHDLHKHIERRTQSGVRAKFEALPLATRVQWFTESVTKLPDTPELTEFDDNYMRDSHNAQSSSNPAPQIQLI